MAATVTVIYATASNTIRRIIVSDTVTQDQIAMSLQAGESALDTPFDTYNFAHDKELKAFVESKIGSPKNNSRCAEIDQVGNVAAVKMADPVVDLSANQLMLDDAAALGDLKQGNQIISTKSATVLTGKAWDDAHAAFLATQGKN